MKIIVAALDPCDLKTQLLSNHDEVTKGNVKL